ncbi:PEP-CTERM sorting domain-containing protein [Nitrospira sp. Nam74]
MCTRLCVLFVLLAIAHTAHAVPMSFLTTTPSFTDGTFTYSNWTAHWSLEENPPDIRPGYFADFGSLNDIEAQSTNGALTLTGLTVRGSNSNPVTEGFLNYSYRVSVPDGMQLVAADILPTMADNVNFTAGRALIDGVNLVCATEPHVGCTHTHAALSRQSVEVTANAYFNIYNGCSLGPATPPGQPPGGGCIFGFSNMVIETRFTAAATSMVLAPETATVPEPSTIILVTTGLLALTWWRRFVLAGSRVTRKATRYVQACIRVDLFLAVFVLLITTHPAHAIPLSDLVDGGTLTTGSLTFSNWQATLTYGEAFPGAVEGLVTTHQATLADLQVTPLPPPSYSAYAGFQVNGFAWEGTVAQSTELLSPRHPPYQMSLVLEYTVTGLGDSGANGSTFSITIPQRISADALHSIDATAPTGEQGRALVCHLSACRPPVGVLPPGTTQAAVRDTLTINPFQFCGPPYVNCAFEIGQDATFGNSLVLFHGASTGNITTLPEPSALVLVLTGLMGFGMARRKK